MEHTSDFIDKITTMPDDVLERFTMFTNQVVPHYICDCLGDYINGKYNDADAKATARCSQCGKVVGDPDYWESVLAEFRAFDIE